MRTDDSIANVDLTGSDYVIERNPFRRRYHVYDGSGTLVVKTKRELFARKATVPFLDSNDRPVYNVEAKNVFEVPGDYTLTEAGTDDVIAVLETEFSSFEHVWRVRSPKGDLWAVIESQNTLLEAARNVIGWPSREYTITGPDGEVFGRLEGRVSLWDTHDLHVSDTGNAPKESLVAAAIAVGALEGNTPIQWAVSDA